MSLRRSRGNPYFGCRPSVTTTLRTGRAAGLGRAAKASKTEPPYRQDRAAHERCWVYSWVPGRRATSRPVSDGPAVRVALSM